MARRLPLLGVAAAALALACFDENVRDEFPLSAGFQPLEPLDPAATFPAPTDTDPHPQALGPIPTGNRDGHDWAHARGYVHAPLASVYAALHDPATSRIHTPGAHWSATVGVEPFPISFQIRYTVYDIITVEWDIRYRGGALEGTDAAPTSVGLRYQKIWGTEHIKVESGSLVATEVAPGVTSLETVGWLDAATQGQADVAGTLRDLFDNLTGALAAMK